MTHRTHETQEQKGSEMVSREIDQVLFIHLLKTDNFPLHPCSGEHQEIVAYLTQLITSRSNQFFRPLVHPAPIQARQSLRPLSVPVGGGGGA